MKQSWFLLLLAVLFGIPPTYAADPPVEKIFAGNVETIVGNTMTKNRAYFTATAVTYGATVDKTKVLIVGGVDSTDIPQNTIDTYDSPGVVGNKVGKFAGAGIITMTKPRAYHTANLLPNGCSAAPAGHKAVLIAGGIDDAVNPVLTAQVLPVNATTGAVTAFKDAGNMKTPRYNHTATNLGGCKVLVVGGNDLFGELQSAEIYSYLPATAPVSTWNYTGSMSQRRSMHTATLLPKGKVLVVGGTVTDATGSPQPLATAEIYDVALGTWTSTGKLFVARYNHTATLLHNGKVLVTGGYNTTTGNAGNLNTAEIYDPDTRVWSRATNFTAHRSEHTATLLLNGEVLIAGGKGGANGVTPLKTLERYNPDDNTWKPAFSLASNRYAHTAILLDNLNEVGNDDAVKSTLGKVLLVGGTNGVATLKSGEIYFPPAVTLRAGTPANVPPVGAPATFNARVNTINADGESTVSFEYGFTTSTQTTDVVSDLALAEGTPDVTKSKAVTGLSSLYCSRKYNYRVKVEDNISGEIAYGQNVEFTTAACTTTELGVTLTDGINSITAGNRENYIATITNSMLVGTTKKAIFKAPSVPNLTIMSTTTAPGIKCCTALDPVGTPSPKCTAISTGTCPADSVVTVPLLQGTGITIPDLPATKKLVFAIGGQVAYNAPSGNLTYSASITAPSKAYMDKDAGNNLGSDITRVNIQTALPDLTVTINSINPPSPAAGSTFEATVTIKNIGTAAVSNPNGGIFVDVWVDRKAGLTCANFGDLSDHPELGDWVSFTPPPLDKGASLQKKVFLTAPSAGTRTLRAFVDSECTIQNEYLENNNQVFKTYTVH